MSNLDNIKYEFYLDDSVVTLKTLIRHLVLFHVTLK